MRQLIILALSASMIGTTGCGSSGDEERVTPVASAAVATAATRVESAAATALPTVSTLAQATEAPNLSETEEAIAAATFTPGPSPLPTATPTLQPAATTAPTIPAAFIEIEGASLPPGFSMIRYADLLGPTSLTVDQAGRIYATSQDGTIHVFVDDDGDGRADRDVLFSSGFNIPLGIVVGLDGETIYVSSNAKISTLRDTDGDLVADMAANLVNNLPVGRHQNDNLKFGPDGMLYMGIGSTCDVCVETDPRSASLMRFDPSTGEGEVIASGLRNAYDLAFHPLTGELFATDNGRDDLGLNAPQEELNLIIPGADYGWPDCWDEGDGPGCAGTETAIAFFQPHSSANSIDFYTGDRFPAEYNSGRDHVVAYVTLLGSFLYPEVESGIARVKLAGSASGYEGEVTWFAQWPGGRPLGLITGRDGALYVGDYANGAIYRISYGP